MNLLDQLLQFLLDGIRWIVSFIQLIWSWSVTQIANVPWEALGDLPIWKMVILALTAGGVGFLLYRAGKILFEAGEGTLKALSTLLSAFVQTLVPVLLAGLVATAGAWIINNVNF